jgi:C4-dicarboxylate transporter
MRGSKTLTLLILIAIVSNSVLAQQSPYPEDNQKRIVFIGVVTDILHVMIDFKEGGRTREVLTGLNLVIKGKDKQYVGFLSLEEASTIYGKPIKNRGDLDRIKGKQVRVTMYNISGGLQLMGMILRLKVLSKRR